MSLRVFVLVGQPLTRQAVEEALAPISAQLHIYHDPIAAVPVMQDAAWDAVVIETVFLDGESINQLLLMMSRRNLPLVTIGDRANGIGQPRIMELVEIPKVMMRVDDSHETFH